MTDPLPLDALRWTCPTAPLAFESTAEVPLSEGMVGQDNAIEALRFGLAFRAPGHHVFVRGLEGTGRLTMVRKLLDQPGPSAGSASDLAFVLDFDQPDQPALLRMGPGRAPAFRDAIAELSRFIAEQLYDDAAGGLVASRRELERETAAAVEQITEPFEAAIALAGLTLAQVTSDDGSHETLLLPMIDGEPTPLDELQEQIADGKREGVDLAALQAEIARHTTALGDVTRSVRAAQRAHEARVTSLHAAEARRLLAPRVDRLGDEYPCARNFLAQIVEHAARHVDLLESEGAEVVKAFAVNVVRTRTPGATRPVIVESAPSVQTLLGTIDAPTLEGTPPHLGIRAGALVRADGGTLVLHARTVLAQEGAWDALVRTLRSGEVQLLPDDQPTTLRPPGIKPQAIPIDVKIVLIGDQDVYALLDESDPEFPNLFKILVDFEESIPRDAVSVGFYAQVIARIAKEDGLPPFHRDAVAALVEHGARVAAERDRLTARFGRIGDIAREAAFLARGPVVARDDVIEAVRRTKRRAEGPGRRFRERVAEGAVRILTEGAAVGEINGLAVISAGPLVYGIPTRITATAGPGSGGAVNVEQEALLSGQIHVKSFHIVSGLLRRLLGAEHPLAFDASIAFEQSYGGIDGDSASGASFAVLLSALTGLPVRQDLAMTGAIDQVGNVLAVGAVNEKIEGFYDCCAQRGAHAGHGVVIPSANAGDLMLRRDVVQAARDGRFAVYAVADVREVLALFFGRAAAEVLEVARERLDAFWRVAGSGRSVVGGKAGLERRIRRVAMEGG